MLNPNTGIEIGKAADEIAAENATLRARLAAAEKVVEAARNLVHGTGGGEFIDLMDALTAYQEHSDGKR